MKKKIRFKEFLYSYAPVTSGTLSDRRLPYNTYSEFYDVYTKKIKEMALTTRSITTIINWIKEFKVKRESFDRYRCEKCYDGRVAESKLKKLEGSEEIFQEMEIYKKHRVIVNNQLIQYKNQKIMIESDGNKILFI